MWGATPTGEYKNFKETISIHAPMWGATQGKQTPTQKPVISIHAPMWGATYRKSKGIAFPENFNPRTHVGCDKLCL